MNVNMNKIQITTKTAVPNITVPIGSTRELAPSEILAADSTDYLLGSALTMRNGRIDKYQFEEGYCQAVKSTFNPSQDGFTFYYYDRDHLGSVRQVIEAEGTDQGTIVQKMNYYPSGLQFCNNVTDSDVQPRRYNGKEYDKMHGLNTYDYGARQYNPVTARWDRMDPLCEKYYGISPYAYCGGNPMNAVDPDGCVIQGVTQKDASMAVKNIREMFVGDVFDNFRELIQQSGKNHDKETLAHISKEALNNAFDGINLSEDQKALVDMVVNTINSSDIHMIEYADNNKVISNVGKEAFSSELAKAGLPVSTIVKKNGGIPTKIISAFGGGGLTVQTEKGTHSVIVNETRLHPNGIAVTTGHEIIGHGRSLASGRGKERQHVDAVRTENLILRVMGINYINDGSNHGPGTVIKDPSMLPDFR